MISSGILVEFHLEFDWVCFELYDNIDTLSGLINSGIRCPSRNASGYSGVFDETSMLN